MKVFILSPFNQIIVSNARYSVKAGQAVTKIPLEYFEGDCVVDKDANEGQCCCARPEFATQYTTQYSKK